MATTQHGSRHGKTLGTDEVLVIGNRKGGATRDRVRRNFGMPHPEGYRKALRAMKIAEQFSRPVISFIDLPVGFPVWEPRSGARLGHCPQSAGDVATACAHHLRRQRRGRIGGALALAVADRVLILENALYFVITPESCAAIMWRDASQKRVAAEAMRISAPEVAELGCVDEIVEEPPEGIHTDRVAGTGLLSEVLKKHLAELQAIPVEAGGCAPAKFRNIAQFFSEG